MSTFPDSKTQAGFGGLLEAARREAGLSSRQLAKQSGVAPRRVSELEAGTDVPTDREIGLLAQTCQVSVFTLLPPGSSLHVLAHGETGPREVVGDDAADALLREYLSMVVELRSGRAIAPPTLRHDDLEELAVALGDTPQAIEARLLELLAASSGPAEVSKRA